jgi:hypothetical protein
MNFFYSLYKQQHLKFRWLFFITVGSYLAYLLYVNTYLVVAGGDEIILASMTNTYLTKGILIDPTNPLLYKYWQVTKQEALGYGNLYFTITSYFCGLFGGFSMEGYRICGFLTAILSLILAHICVTHKNYLHLKYGYFFILLYLFDVAFLQTIKQFRMDQMVLCFVLCAIFCCLYTDASSNKRKYSAIYPLLSGFFAASALLTSPRAAVLLVSLGLVYLLRSVYNKRKIKELAIFIAGVIGLYSIWIFVKFGSLGNFIDFYAHNDLQFVVMKRKFSLIETFLLMKVGIRFYPFQYPALVAICLAVMVQLKEFRKVFLQDELMFMSLLNFVVYYLLIQTQTCSIYVLPFVLIIILKTLQNKQHLINQTFAFYGLVSCLAINFVCLFAYPVIKLHTFNNVVNHLELYKQIKNAIPKNSNVVGIETYYYGTTCNELNFQCFDILAPNIKDKSLVDIPATIDKMIAIHKTSFKPQYFIVSTENRILDKEQLAEQAYFKHFNLVPHKKIEISGNDAFWQKWLKTIYAKFGLTPPKNYNGMIYKVVFVP